MSLRANAAASTSGPRVALKGLAWPAALLHRGCKGCAKLLPITQQVLHLQSGEELVGILVLLDVRGRAVIVLEGLPEGPGVGKGGLAQRQLRKQRLQLGKDAVVLLCVWHL